MGSKNALSAWKVVAFPWESYSRSLQRSAKASFEPGAWLCAETSTTLHRVVRNRFAPPAGELWSRLTWTPLLKLAYRSGPVIERKKQAMVCRLTRISTRSLCVLGACARGNRAKNLALVPCPRNKHAFRRRSVGCFSRRERRAAE